MGRGAEINEINPEAAVAVWDQRRAEAQDFLRKHGQNGWFIGAIDEDGMAHFAAQFFPPAHEPREVKRLFAIFMLACMDEALRAMKRVNRAEVS